MRYEGCTTFYRFMRHLDKNTIQKALQEIALQIMNNQPEGLIVFPFQEVFSNRYVRPTVLKDFTLAGSIKVSCLKLISAMPSDISEEWLTGRIYITFEGATSSNKKRKDDFAQFTEKSCTIFVDHKDSAKHKLKSMWVVVEQISTCFRVIICTHTSKLL